MASTGGDNARGDRTPVSLSVDLMRVLAPRTRVHSTTGSVSVRTIDQEGLLSLRARLAIMEVPEEQEAQWIQECGHGARLTAEALKSQLQVTTEMRDAVEGLRQAGHPGYQDGWEMR